MERLYAAIIAGVFTLIGSFTAYMVAVGKARKELKQQLFMKQKYEYYLRLKYWAHEFRSRLKHIVIRMNLKTFEGEVLDEQDLEIKRERMKKRFQLEGQKKDLAWYFGADKQHGGYFFTSTVYLTCMLFCFLQKIASQYPYLHLELDKKSRPASKGLPKKSTMHWFIKHIKLALSGKGGIPYGIIDSVGEFMIRDGKELNYEEFCLELMDDSKRIKFMNIIRFWQNIGAAGDTQALEKMSRAYEVLRELKCYAISEKE